MRLQIEKAYPAGVMTVGKRSEISAGVTPLTYPMAARTLKAMVARVARMTRIDLNESFELALSIIW